MTKPRKDVTVKGRSFGVFVITFIQLINGVIHAYYGTAMVLGAYSAAVFSTLPETYSVYTLVYGVLNLVFACLLWIGKRSGWIGTMSVSIFVICVDALALLNLLNVLGIPAFSMAIIGEILYSSLFVVYLLQSQVRAKFNI